MWQTATGTSRAVFWRISLNGTITTSGAQPHYVRPTGTCSLLAKNSEVEQKTRAPAPTVWGIVTRLPHTSLDMSTISKHPLTCICFMKTFFFVSSLVRLPFICVPQQTIIWYKWLSKQTRSFHSSWFSDQGKSWFVLVLQMRCMVRYQPWNLDSSLENLNLEQ